MTFHKRSMPAAAIGVEGSVSGAEGCAISELKSLAYRTSLSVASPTPGTCTHVANRLTGQGRV